MITISEIRNALNNGTIELIRQRIRAKEKLYVDNDDTHVSLSLLIHEAALMPDFKKHLDAALKALENGASDFETDPLYKAVTISDAAIAQVQINQWLNS